MTIIFWVGDQSLFSLGVRIEVKCYFRWFHRSKSFSLIHFERVRRVYTASDNIVRLWCYCRSWSDAPSLRQRRTVKRNSVSDERTRYTRKRADDLTMKKFRTIASEDSALWNFTFHSRGRKQNASLVSDQLEVLSRTHTTHTHTHTLNRRVDKLISDWRILCLHLRCFDFKYDKKGRRN